MAAPLIGDLQIRIAAGIAGLQRDLTAAQASVKNFGGTVANQNRALRTGTAGFRNFGTIAQQAGFQVGDFAVQIASGTNALRAGTQQLPQFLGAFGPWGAVIGAAAAVVGVLLTKIDLFGSEAAEAQRMVKQLSVEQATGNSVTDLYTAALDRASTALQTNKERADAAADAQLRLAKETVRAAMQAQNASLMELQAQKAIREEQAAMERANPSALAGAEGMITGEKPGINPVLQGINSQIAATVQNMRKLQEEFSKLNDPAQLGTTREAAEKVAKEAADQSERATESIEKQIRALQSEAEAQALSARERAIAIELQRAEEAARAGNISLTETQIQKIKELAAASFDAAQMKEYEIQRQIELAKLSMEQQKDFEDASKKAADEQKKAMDELSTSINGVASGIAGAALGFQSWEQAGMKAIDAVFGLLTKYLEGLGNAGSGGGGIGDIFGSLLGAIFSGIGSGAGGFAGVPSGFAMADGGSGMVNKPTLFLAGEAGPERFSFKPMTGGDDWNGGGNTYIINAPGASKEGLMAVQRELRALNASIEPRARAEVINARRRGGQMADAFG